MTTIATSKIQDLLDFIDSSPSPWHAVATSAEKLINAGFIAINESESWQLETGGRYFVSRGGSSHYRFCDWTKFSFVLWLQYGGLTY
jgi:aspartyl aminopeptidase